MRRPTAAPGRVSHLLVLVGGALLLLAAPASAQDTTNDNCPPGFHLDLRSGVSCVQDPETLPENGGLSYTGASICPLGGRAVYEWRETTDGQPAPGTGGQSAFAFLLRCEQLAEGEAPGTTFVGDDDPAADPSSPDDVEGDGVSTVTDDSADRERRLIVIGLGGGGAVVSVAVARAMMRRWGMTPKQLLRADLAPGERSAAPVSYGPTGEGGYDDPLETPEHAEAPAQTGSAEPGTSLLERLDRGAASPAPSPQGVGTYFDWKTGRWIDFSTDPTTGDVQVTGHHQLDHGRSPGPGGISQADTAPPGQPEGFRVGLDPATGAPAATYQVGQPGDPFHVDVRRTRRDLTISGGVQPAADVTIDFHHGPGGTRTGVTWKPNPSTSVELRNRPGNTQLGVKVRF